MAKKRTLDELRQSKDYGYVNPHDGRPYYKDKFDYIKFENYIYPEIIRLQKEYPNNMEFGTRVRSLLMGFKNYNYPGPTKL